MNPHVFWSAMVVVLGLLLLGVIGSGLKANLKIPYFMNVAAFWLAMGMIIGGVAALLVILSLSLF